MALGRRMRLFLMLGMVSLIFVLELVVGHLAGSLALVADSFHMLSDAMSSIVAAVAIKFSKISSKEKNTFGWARAETLGAVINGIFLLALCFTILLHAIERIIAPEKIEKPEVVLIVGIIGLAVNILGLFLFHEHGGHSHASHDTHEHCSKRDSALHVANGHTPRGVNSDENVAKKSKLSFAVTKVLKTDVDEDCEAATTPMVQRSNHSTTSYPNSFSEESLPTSPADPLNHSHSHSDSHAHGHVHSHNMRAVFLHVFCDALGSILVIISAGSYILLERYKVIPEGHEDHLAYLDPLLSIVMVCIISIPTVRLIAQSSGVLLNNVPKKISPEKLATQILLKFIEIESVHNFYIWKLTPDVSMGSIHVVVNKLSDEETSWQIQTRLLEDLNEFMERKGVKHTTIQFEDYCQQVSHCRQRHGQSLSTNGIRASRSDLDSNV